MPQKPISTAEVESRHVQDATGLKIETLAHKRSRWETRLVGTWGQGKRGEWSSELGICKGCGCEIDATPAVAEVLGAPIAIPTTVCDDCMILVREHYDPLRDQRAEDNATATPKWDANCGARHKAVVLGEVRPPQVDWKAYERAIAWTPADGRGLVLTGAPGTGKTSAFWALARSLEAAGHGPITLSSLELGRVLGEAGRDIRDVGWLYRCRVLMVDDLGKERASPGVASLLWEVLDKRLASNLPVILTTNFTGAELAARFGEQHLGDAIRRRISELCRQIRFAAEDAKAA